MANDIMTAVKWTEILDEVYKQEAKTSILDSGPEIVQATTNAGEFKVAKIDMDGLADYDRSTGYTNGDVSLTWETHKHNYERGRMFTVDEMDDEETVRLTFANLAGQFVRVRVAPEIDAFRFASYAAAAGNKVGAALADGAAYIKALRTATTAMDDAEVPAEGRILFITSAGEGMIADLDTTASKLVMGRFAQVVVVPQNRFNSAVELLDGKTAGEEAGGFRPAAESKALNFVIVEPSALIQRTKHESPKVITPELNQNADAWKFGYRNYGIASVYELKANGIYVHHAA